MNKVFLALGSNRGDKFQYLLKALNLINCLPGTSIVSLSPVYETFPYGVISQDEFLNMAVAVFSELTPRQLLVALKTIEQQTGRLERERWHEREIDIDILLYGDLEVDEADLKIPHRELLKRDFFILPLLDLEPGISLPGTGIFLKDLEITVKKPYIKGLNRKFFEIKNGLVCLNEQ
ncbi:MAG: 2-amino-4-hydroxy-6-hydroxymethyldihydropteridine diphosphokinase [Ignavibacteria bacterium]|nr:2-amino-4-hydroxy-6-hydroxymethyldihydropteridine diphosphokinase [Ignavibacteria bacterium]